MVVKKALNEAWGMEHRVKDRDQRSDDRRQKVKKGAFSVNYWILRLEIVDWGWLNGLNWQNWLNRYSAWR
jgi:hypothetical protein